MTNLKCTSSSQQGARVVALLVDIASNLPLQEHLWQRAEGMGHWTGSVWLWRISPSLKRPASLRRLSFDQTALLWRLAVDRSSRLQGGRLEDPMFQYCSMLARSISTTSCSACCTLRGLVESVRVHEPAGGRLQVPACAGEPRERPVPAPPHVRHHCMPKGGAACLGCSLFFFLAR